MFSCCIFVSSFVIVVEVRIVETSIVSFLKSWRSESAGPHPGEGGGFRISGNSCIFYVCVSPEFYLTQNGSICIH